MVTPNGPYSMQRYAALTGCINSGTSLSVASDAVNKQHITSPVFALSLFAPPQSFEAMRNQFLHI